MAQRQRVRHVQVGADDDRRLRRASPCTVRQRHLVDKHLHLAKEGARRYTHAHRLGEDAVGIASLALLMAAQDWNPERRPVFEDYARKRIKNELSTAMKEVYHRRGYNLNDRGQPVGVPITGNADRPGEVADVADYRTWRDVDAEDEVCWLLSRLTPERAGFLRMRFWSNLEVSEAARETDTPLATARRHYDHTLSYLRDELFTSYQRTPGAYELLPASQGGTGKGTKSLVRWDGRDWTLSELTERLGLPYSTISKRIHLLKWPVERALTEPVQPLRGKRPRREKSVPTESPVS